LKDYFDLTQYEIQDINLNMRTIISAINQTVFPYYKCGGEGEHACDGHYLCALQYGA
jgi:hypothetical protein